MENISINTSQNVAIEQPVASVGERVAAGMLDYLFFIGYLFLVMIIMNALPSKNNPILWFILSLPLLLYHLIAEITMNGQSWGKKIFKIKVIKIDGSEPGFFDYFTRWIFRIVDMLIIFGGVGIFTIIINGRGQRLGDLAAGTTVIRLKKEELDNTIFTEISPDYQINFPEVRKLSPDDIYTVKEVLDFLKREMYSQKSGLLAIKTKKAVETKMGIESNMVPSKFLDLIIKDYNKINVG